MTSSGRWNNGFFRTIAWHRHPIGWAVHGTLLMGTASAVLLCSAGVAYSGPCTAQIAQLEQQTKKMPPGPQTGPTWSQTLGAQLHNQPTPRDVEHAESVANTGAEAAVEAAKKADAEGNADQCNAALTKARRLYGLD